MDLRIGYCCKCGKTITIKLQDMELSDKDIYCDEHNPDLKRDRILKELLKKPWWKRLFS